MSTTYSRTNASPCASRRTTTATNTKPRRNSTRPRTAASIGAAYRLAPLWTLGLDAFEETRDYRDIDRRDEDIRFDLSLLRQFTPHWSGRLDYFRNERNSTALDEGFRENVFMVTVIYKR